jgi:C4-dicarboxylate transporter DctM subunit
VLAGLDGAAYGRDPVPRLGISGTAIKGISHKALPFVAIMTNATLIIAYVPAISLTLPSLLGY